MKFEKHLRNLDVSIAALSLLVLVTLTITLVILRDIFDVTAMGSDEFSQYLLVCLVFLGLPAVARTGSHIKMEEFLSVLPRKLQRGLRILIALCAFASFLIVSYSAFGNIMENLGARTPSLGMPLSVFFAPTLIGFFLLAIEYLILIIRLVGAKEGSSTPPRGGKRPPTSGV